MMNYKKLVLSVNEVQKIVKKEYGIEGSALKLQGEIDINYKISTRNSQDYILKISRPDSPSDYLDFQIKILKLSELLRVAFCYNLDPPRTINTLFQGVEMWHFRQF